MADENVIVVNLKNRAHSVYYSGSEAAIAATGRMSLGSLSDKTVTDVLIHGRCDGDITLVSSNSEATRRFHTVTHRTEQTHLTTRRVKLAMGLKGPHWSFRIFADAGVFCEVRSMELLVTDFKRHI